MTPILLGPPPAPNRVQHPYAGTIAWPGLPRILIETAAGQVRRGVDADGQPWATTMPAHYGEFEGTAGLDGDPVDVFVGPDATAPVAYVVHQKVPGTQRPDEDKVVLGCWSAGEAEALYRRAYSRGGFFHGITPWPVAVLAAHLRDRGAWGRRLDHPEAGPRVVVAVPVPTPMEIEIPDALGDLMWGAQETAMAKGAGHKYLRRVPTGNPQRPYRYYYRVTGGAGMGHASEFVVGAAFRVRHGDKEGHFHVVGADGERVRLRHDETGHEMEIAPAALREMLRREHATEIDAHHARVRRDLAQAAKTGSPKQRERLETEARKYGVGTRPTVEEINAAFAAGGEKALTAKMMNEIGRLRREADADGAPQAAQDAYRAINRDARTTESIETAPQEREQARKQARAAWIAQEHAKHAPRWGDPNYRVELTQGGRHKDTGALPGDIVSLPQHPGPVVITKRRTEYVREDGLSFGLPDDQGWWKHLEARPATAEEVARHAEYGQQVEALRAALGERQEAREALISLIRGGRLGSEDRAAHPPPGSRRVPLDTQAPGSYAPPSTHVHVDPDGSHATLSEYVYDMGTYYWRTPMTPEIRDAMARFERPIPAEPEPPTADPGPPPVVPAVPVGAAGGEQKPKSRPGEHPPFLVDGERVTVRPARPGQEWHNIALGEPNRAGFYPTTYGWNGTRWARGDAPPEKILAAVAERGHRPFVAAHAAIQNEARVRAETNARIAAERAVREAEIAARPKVPEPTPATPTPTAASGLPDLSGTPKQVTWAETIRRRILGGVQQHHADAMAEVEAGKHDKDTAKKIAKIPDALARKKKASWWIDNFARAGVAGAHDVAGIARYVGSDDEIKRAETDAPDLVKAGFVGSGLRVVPVVPDAGIEIEIPEALGSLLDAALLSKGAGHKYLRKVPTGNPRRPWRYFYRVTGGAGLGHDSEMVVGAKFAVRHDGHAGHFEVVGVDGDRVTIRHDETGHTETVSKTALGAMLHREHAERIQATRDRARKDLEAVGRYGNERQRARVQAEAAKVHERFGGVLPRPAVPVAPVAPAGHQEVGSHVAGARKDLASRSLSEIANLPVEDAARLITKEKLLPKATEEEWRARGGTPGGWILRKAVERAVAPRPVDTTVAARLPYVQALDFVARGLDACRTAKDVDNLLVEFENLAQGRERVGIYPSEDAARAALDGMGIRSYRTRIDILAPGRWAAFAPRNSAAESVNPYQAKARALGKSFTSLLEGAYTPRMAAFALQHVYGGGGTSKPYMTALKEALTADSKGWGALDSERAAPREDKGAPKRYVWARDISEKPERVGGRPVDQADAGRMLQEFGLHNVQFGNWTTQEDREHHLAWCQGALRDLGDVLGLPPAAIALQPLTARTERAPLSIGIGARGKGSARAHYEPAARDSETGKLAPIINLTKFAGGGTLAHEWGHFVDNLLAEAHGGAVDRRGNRTGAPGFVSGGDGARLPADLGAALRGVTKAIQGPRYAPTQFLIHADAMGGGYWKSPHEMFARAFESYVQDKLTSQGRKNSYLVAGTDKTYRTGKSMEGSESSTWAVPEVAEAKARRDATLTVLDAARAPHIKAALGGRSLNERNASMARAHADAQPDVHAARVAHQEASRAYHALVRQHRQNVDAQPYPQGEERRAIHAAFDGFFDVVRRTGALEKALAALFRPLPAVPIRRVAPETSPCP